MENNLIPPQNLPPFLKFCYTVGILPTSYKITWTYEEQVLEAIRFIKEEIIPVVNANAMATTELQEKFVELVNYVETYFDDLDLQDEVNNKLDEMADSGELAEIISEYLNLQAIFAFNNVSALSSAQNLANGSFARTFGKITYNDGKGAFYKIRTLTSQDVIDGDNIVALINYPTLIAEKMPDDAINSINTKIGNLTNLVTSEKTNLVGAINEVKNGQYNLIPFACIIRPTTEGWIILNDSGHQPLNVQSVQINGDRLQINHDMDASKVIAFNISPDETFSRFGIHAGASVGLDTSLVSFAIDTTATAYIRYTAQNGFQLQADYSNNVHNISWDSENSKLTINFTSQLACKQFTDWVASYNNANNMNNYRPFVTWASASSVTVEVYNTAGVKQTTPASFDRLFVNVKYNGDIKANDLVLHPVSGANFFISGWMLA